MKKEEWFASWFDTPFYHTLYKHRDFKEAENFITALLNYLQPNKDAKILDLACGKGRHSFFIAKDNFDVTGVDLSKQSIEWANSNYKLSNLSFDVHDMRQVYKENYFDYVFNFFTSFGYFENDQENQNVVNGMAKNLKNGGTLILDYINIYKAVKNLKPFEKKTIDGIEFNITKEVIDNYIVKNINFNHEGKQYHFQEKVKCLYLDDFLKFFDKANLKLVDTFGNYQLEPYELGTANRLIMQVEK